MKNVNKGGNIVGVDFINNQTPIITARCRRCGNMVNDIEGDSDRDGIYVELFLPQREIFLVHRGCYERYKKECADYIKK